MNLFGLVTDGVDDISDPSDWSNSKFPNLGQLDSSLRCQICKDFLKAPVLTSCGHTFCSICIRRSITESHKCPICLEETYESGLRKVLLLDNITKWFTDNRTDLLNCIEIDHVNDSQEEDLIESELLSNDPQIVNDTVADTSKIIDSDVIEIEDDNDDELAACPICGKFMPRDIIEGSHIDKCLKNGTKRTPNTIKSTSNGPISRFFFDKSATSTQKLAYTTSSTSSVSTTSISQLQPTPQTQPKSFKNKQRLPNLDTSLSTSKLRERMNTYNISTHGTRVQLEQRMKEYINLYNANLDSVNPVNERVLVDRLQKWERLVGTTKPKHATPQMLMNEQMIKRQKTESKEWNARNKDHFADLIKKARSNMQKQRDKTKAQKEADENQDQFSDDDTELLL